MSALGEKLPGVFVVMLDQLAGHWVDGVEVKPTGSPPKY